MTTRNGTEDEYTKIGDLVRNLITKIARRGRAAKKVNVQFNQEMTAGERSADRMAPFGGIWTFISLFGGILFFWVTLNSVSLILHQPFDPSSYIHLNLVLSMLATLRAPVIVMSQHRLQAQNDYEINLRAEMEIRDLHDKLDGLRLKAWHELWQMQQQQIQLLEAPTNHLEVDHQLPTATPPAPGS